jgi:hypothetical protein
VQDLPKNIGIAFNSATVPRDLVAGLDTTATLRNMVPGFAGLDTTKAYRSVIAGFAGLDTTATLRNMVPGLAGLDTARIFAEIITGLEKPSRTQSALTEIARRVSDLTIKAH